MGLILLTSTIMYLMAYLVWYFLIRNQISDSIRQGLFSLRAELFTCFNNSEVGLDHPGHILLRSKINVLIKENNKMMFSSLFSLKAFTIFSSTSKEVKPAANKESLINQYKDLDKEFNDQLQSIEIRMYLYIVESLIKKNLFFLISLKTFSFMLFLLSPFFSFTSRINKMIYNYKITLGYNSFDKLKSIHNMAL